jgi:HK97 gp10 family phage protein
MAADVQFTDNAPQVLQELATKIEAALEACGNQAVSHAKQNITSASRVDTGALRNSMNHLVQGEECYVGTNQEYAIYNEFGTGIYCDEGVGRQTPWSYQDAHGDWHTTRGMKPIHFLKNAIADHTGEYKQIIEQQLKS